MNARQLIAYAQVTFMTTMVSLNNEIIKCMYYPEELQDTDDIDNAETTTTECDSDHMRPKFDFY